ncbi:MAG: hypothetical protein ACOY4W_16815 [Thermodesulfobacteriota bacterium]
MTDNDNATITLPRSGQAPLQFPGRLEVDSTSQRFNSPCQRRWHQLYIYRHQDGRLVLAISYFSGWQGEVPRHHAYICTDEAELRRRIAEHDPLADLIGLPPGEQFAVKQERMKGILRQCWDNAVSSLLDKYPEKI